MKRFFLFVLAATALAACSTDTTQDLAPEIPTAPDELQVSFDEEDTRIQLGENGAPVWTEGDLVSVFYKSDGNDCYKFTGKTGDREGTLKRTSVGEWSRRGDNVVVVYPYSKSYIISLSANTVEASLPDEQTYAKNSYGIGSSLMIATGDYKQFALKNVCGWLKLQFTGSGYVSKIVLRGNNGEQVAGNMLVCADDASCILAEASADIDDDEVGGALITDDDILTSVTLNCGDGVALNSKTPTAFYVALPPQTFEKGLTAIMYNQDGIPKEISTKNAITIERNHILPMTSAEIKLLPATNQIWYTSSNGKIVKPDKTDVFGANITSNTYKNGVGIITFDGDVTTIGKSAFAYCKALTSVTIPDSVTTIGSSAFISCSALTSITIPDSVTEIGSNAFTNCKALTSVTIPDSVTTIGVYAFSECSALTSITIPDSVTTIGYGTFAGCEALKAFYGKFASKDNRCLIVNGVLNSFAPAGLTTYSIPDSVTSIGTRAFSHCDALTSVTIPDSVTTIGYHAFYDCRALKAFYGKFASEDNRCLIVDGVLTYFAPAGLTTYSILNGVTTIGNYAFNGCSALTSVTIPDSVTTIGNYAFNGCSALTSVTIPDSVMTIGGNAFCDCSALTSVTIPDSVTTIGYYAFGRCSALTSVTIGNSVTTIGGYAFYKCKALKKVYCKPTTPPIADKGRSSYWEAFNNNVSGRKIYVPNTSVDAYKAADGWNEYANAIIAFPNNQILYTSSDGNIVAPYKTDVFGANIVSNTYENGVGVITFAGDVAMIGEDAFYKCSALTSVTIPDSVTTIGEDAFRDCDALTRATIGKSVTTIGDNAFYKCSALTSVTIPDSVTTIGEYAFYSCDALKAFYGKFASKDNRCLIVDGVLNSFAPAGLTTYSIPNSVTTIGDYAFYNCTSLTSVTIPDSVTTIGDYAFYDCTSLTSVAIGDSVTTIGNYAFRDCDALKSVTIPDSVKTIGIYAFYSCDALKSVTIPDSVKTIGKYAFSGCSALTSVTIGNSVTTIGDYAFRDCSSLTSVTIPDSVTTIGNYAFYNCRALTSVTIPDSVTKIGSCAFQSCSALTSVTIGNSVTTIGNYAFEYCDALTSVTIPDSVTKIGERAFCSCDALTSVTIPDSVTTIGGAAFWCCDALKEVYCKPTTPPSLGDSYVFDANASGRKIYVPTASVDAYKAKQYWSEYADAIYPYTFTE